MKLAFLITPLGISGGLNVIFQWARLLAEANNEVYVVVPERKDLHGKLHFLAENTPGVSLICFEDVRSIDLDLALATWWESWRHLPSVRARQRGVFVQSLEAAFYEPGDIRQETCMQLLRHDLPTICVANWISEYLISYLGRVPSSMRTVVNAFDKALFAPTNPVIPKAGKVRFLVEGPHFLPYKGIPETLKILNNLEVEYVWVGSFTDKNLVGRNCVGIFSGVPYRDMPGVYASADVMVKLSSIEGMFGPPLEMFGTGGTALVWNVFGHDEFMAHGYNSWVVPMHDFKAIEKAVAYLAKSPEWVARLKRGAQITASCWPSWNDLRYEMVSAVEALTEMPSSEALMSSLANAPFPKLATCE